MTTAVVYSGCNDTHVNIVPKDAYGCIHVVAFKKREYANRIVRKPLTIGAYTFEPGKSYTKFGSDRKTSDNFIRYEGKPLVFVGIYFESALFLEEGDEPFEVYEYPVCYWAWIFDVGLEVFISISALSSGRVMEMGR